MSWVVEGVGGMWNRYVALVGVEAENRELREDNDKLRKQLAATTRKAFDVEALEDLAVVKRRTPADSVGALRDRCADVAAVSRRPGSGSIAARKRSRRACR